MLALFSTLYSYGVRAWTRAEQERGGGGRGETRKVRKEEQLEVWKSDTSGKVVVVVVVVVARISTLDGC